MLVEFISEHIHLSKNDKQQIAHCFNKSVFDDGEILLREGSYAKKLFFLEKGFVRSFYRKEDGNEKTHWIYADNDFFTSWYSFLTGKPSFETLQVIGKSSIYVISENSYLELYKNNSAFNTFINSYYQHLIAEMDFISKSFLHLSAKEKYQYLLNNNPKMILEIKLGYIASLLDISQETLSRVRKQL